MQKAVLSPYQIITAGDVSQATITSLATNIKLIDNVCMELVWTGTPVGTFQLLGSVTGNNYFPIALTPTAPAGSSGGTLVDLNQLSFPWIKLVYTKTSGTGTLNAWIGGKQL